MPGKLILTAEQFLARPDHLLSSDIKQVRLTTWPDLSFDMDGNTPVAAHLPGRTKRVPTKGWGQNLEVHTAECLAALAAEWPGVSFELPDPAPLPARCRPQPNG